VQTRKTPEAGQRRWTRRQLLAAAGATGAGVVALAAAGYAGYRWPHPKPAPVPSLADVYQFHSRPDLNPPRATVTRRDAAFATGPDASRLIFAALKGYTADGPGQQGPMIIDTQGRLVWFQPSSQSPFNLRVQQYQGKPVLTWWEGQVITGYGQGNGVIVDSSYKQIATIKAGNGLQADLHELTLTPQGTALITAYQSTTADLTPVGGSNRGQILNCFAQEVDVQSGSVLFQWASLDHVGVGETYNTPSGSGPFDYFHINSIAAMPDGDLLISARNTWALYKVSRQTGDIVWRLNGKQSNFSIGPGAPFSWQHDAQPQGATSISLFDDGDSPPEESQSRGLILNLNLSNMTVSLQRQYTNPARLLAPNQGSMQILPDGRVFVGWGAQPYFSEFSQDGQMLLDGRFPTDDQSYRTYSFSWEGQPTDTPALVVGPNGAGGQVAYVSWNGATGIVRWQILAGKDPSSLQPAANALRSGFETAINVNNPGPYYAAVAFGAGNRELGRSQPVRQ
jgi:hypothetical protein